MGKEKKRKKKKGKKKEEDLHRKERGMQQSLWLRRQETLKPCANFTCGIFGLFSALTHALLARTRNGATSCSSNSAAPSSQPSPSPLLPLHGAGSSQPCSAEITSAGLSLVSPGQRQAGMTRGDPSSAGPSVLGGRVAHARAVQNVLQ